MVSPNVIFWEVDTQADFMVPGGKLYVPGAEKLIPNLRRLVNAAREGRVFLVSDACVHTLEDEEFKQWPPHCVRGTPGAEIIPETRAENFYRIPNQAGIALPEDLGKFQQIILEKQTLDVFAPIAQRLGMDAIRAELESLASTALNDRAQTMSGRLVTATTLLRVPAASAGLMVAQQFARHADATEQNVRSS